MTATLVAEPLSPGLVSRGQTTSLLTSTAEVAKRTVRHFVRTPQLIIVGTIQGAMFLLIFRYVFGGAIDIGGGVSYVDFLVPGFVVTSVLFAGMGAAAGVAEDRQRGLYDRLRSLPIPRASVLSGRALADTSLLTWNLAITVAVGFAVGFRLNGDAFAGLAAFGLCVLFGVAFMWMFITVGLVAGNAQVAQGMALMVFPLTFVSSAYVPVDTLPGWMQSVAKHQPITYMVDTVRSLSLGNQSEALLGHDLGHYLTGSLLWSVALIAVFAPLAVWRFRKA